MFFCRKKNCNDVKYFENVHVKRRRKKYAVGRNKKNDLATMNMYKAMERGIIQKMGLCSQ
jgi:hypothetical protein